MLNLFTLKKNHVFCGVDGLANNDRKKTKNLPVLGLSQKHFPCSLREWKNSIYVYNKKSLDLIPSTTVSINNIIKSYFNLYNKRLEAKMRTKRLLLRLRRLSSNRFYISTGGFKHTNNKVLINLYIFNRQKNNYLLTLKKSYLKSFLTKKTELDITRIVPSSTGKKSINTNIKLIKKLKLINHKGIQAVKTVNKDKYLLIKALNTVGSYETYLYPSTDKSSSMLSANNPRGVNNNYSINKFKDLSQYTNDFYKNLIRKSLKKVRMYFYYRQLLYINRSKLNYTYLQHLKNQLENMYNKNVEFNIININRFYLNSDILSESISAKISRNRRKISKYLNNLKNKIKVKKKGFFKNIAFVLSSGVNTLTRKNLSQKDLSGHKLLLRNNVIKNLKYKYVTGFRLKASGRLNRRFTASRSLSKLKYKGNLLNIDSSYKGLSSVLLKGNLKSNTQYTKLKSKSRVGSFGIKGWISGN